MSSEVVDPQALPTPPEAVCGKTYLNASQGVVSWLLTKDHKRIAILYLIPVTLMFFVGGAVISINRLHLLTPEGLLLEADTYNKFFTIHGLVMIFFFLVPVIPAVLGNFFLPMMIGAKDLAFPADQPAELVPVYARRRLGLVRDARRRG